MTYLLGYNIGSSSIKSSLVNSETTAGISGVIYDVIDKPAYDSQSHMNTFIHVNHKKDNSSYEVLLCKNGCSILYSWLKNNIFSTVTGTQFEINSSDDSQGAARGAGLGAKIYRKPDNAFVRLNADSIIYPNKALSIIYQDVCNDWFFIFKNNLA